MITRGPRGKGGWRELEQRPHPDPEGALDPSGVTPLAALIHSSDWHLCDPSSPARLEYLDRHFDPDHPNRLLVGPVGTYRPHEFLTRHVAHSFLEAANRVDKGPTFGRKIDALILTGDSIDNAHANELDDFAALLTGGIVPTQSLREWVGSTKSAWDEHYWHPDNSDTHRLDRPSRLFGFPRAPGLLESAELAFTSPGSAHPWLAVHGNHDALLQGTVAPNRDLLDLALGVSRIVGISGETTAPEIVQALSQVGPARYIHDDSFPREFVSENPERRFLGQGEFRSRLTGLTGALTPIDPASPPGANYWASHLGQMVVVAIDTVNPHGGYHGSLDEVQLGWLDEVLRNYPHDWILIASHHPPRTLVNDFRPAGAARRVLAGELLDLLHRSGNVFAWLTGHEHENLLSYHADRVGSVIPEITTASLIDWPQHGRILELGIDAQGNRVISSSILDHCGPASPSEDLSKEHSMAAWSRLLSANDYQRRDPLASLDRAEGLRADRYFHLVIPPGPQWRGRTATRGR